MKKYRIFGAILGIISAAAIIISIHYKHQLKTHCAKDGEGAKACECLIETMRKSDSILNWHLYWQIVTFGSTINPHPEKIPLAVAATFYCALK